MDRQDSRNRGEALEGTGRAATRWGFDSGLSCPLRPLAPGNFARAERRLDVRQVAESFLFEFDESLELLARAYEDADDAADAVATLQKALALIPRSPARQTAEGRLARFQEALRYE